MPRFTHLRKSAIQRSQDSEPYAQLPGTLPDDLGFGPDGRLYVACYQPSQIVRIDEHGNPAVPIRDGDAIVLAHPANIGFHGSTAKVTSAAIRSATSVATIRRSAGER
jgi:hypothetical protein